MHGNLSARAEGPRSLKIKESQRNSRGALHLRRLIDFDIVLLTLPGALKTSADTRNPLRVSVVEDSWIARAICSTSSISAAVTCLMFTPECSTESCSARCAVSPRLCEAWPLRLIDATAKRCGIAAPLHHGLVGDGTGVEGRVDIRFGSKPAYLFGARMSAFAGCGHRSQRLSGLRRSTWPPVTSIALGHLARHRLAALLGLAVLALAPLELVESDGPLTILALRSGACVKLGMPIGTGTRK
jgi:hypothetical protein